MRRQNGPPCHPRLQEIVSPLLRSPASLGKSLIHTKPGSRILGSTVPVLKANPSKLRGGLLASDVLGAGLTQLGERLLGGSFRLLQISATVGYARGTAGPTEPAQERSDSRAATVRAGTAQCGSYLSTTSRPADLWPSQRRGHAPPQTRPRNAAAPQELKQLSGPRLSSSLLRRKGDRSGALPTATAAARDAAALFMLQDAAERVPAGGPDQRRRRGARLQEAAACCARAVRAAAVQPARALKRAARGLASKLCMGPSA